MKKMPKVLLLAGLAGLALAAGAARAEDAPAAAQQGGPAEGPSPASRGKIVYDAHCVECHGSSGKVDGPAALLLNPRPRDFASGRYKIRSTESGSLPSAVAQRYEKALRVIAETIKAGPVVFASGHMFGYDRKRKALVIDDLQIIM